MKILVTGGAGFIGSHVVDTYIALGHEVVIVDNLSTGSRNLLNPHARFHETDIRLPALAEVFETEKPEAVTHLAAQIDVRRSVEEPSYDADVNILGSLNVLENCVKSGVRKVIFASPGGAVYGEPTQLPVDEDCLPKPLCHYGAAKLSVEHYIYLYRHLYNLDYTVLRFTNVYGPRQSPHGEAGVCSILIGLMLSGKQPTLYGFGEAVRDYVYVGDIAQAAALALNKGGGEVMNLCSGIGTTVREIFDILKEILSFPHEPILRDLRPGEIQRIYASREKAARVLGWVPEMSLRDGLERTVRHIQGQ
ncbi:MAG: NAD-dependent epimerase/dehydratase family protein [Candidatus Hydrogenedentes bacterium]|nr:NAD-dependent epimerase/dehydratase family protein [Candidatus Hydrogenedentota bacterium]